MTHTYSFYIFYQSFPMEVYILNLLFGQCEIQMFGIVELMNIGKCRTYGFSTFVAPFLVEQQTSSLLSNMLAQNISDLTRERPCWPTSEILHLEDSTAQNISEYTNNLEDEVSI